MWPTPSTMTFRQVGVGIAVGHGYLFHRKRLISVLRPNHATPQHLQRSYRQEPRPQEPSAVNLRRCPCFKSAGQTGGRIEVGTPSSPLNCCGRRSTGSRTDCVPSSSRSRARWRPPSCRSSRPCRIGRGRAADDAGLGCDGRHRVWRAGNRSKGVRRARRDEERSSGGALRQHDALAVELPPGQAERSTWR